jgi:Zn-dependent metallo-hydrolase RNA specificity domain
VVIFATPGNLSTAVSLDILHVWYGDARNVVMVPGYCFSNTLAARLQEGGDRGEGMDIRCTLLNMSFSAHADARGITRTVRRLYPRAVMLVHGNEARIQAFQPLLREALGGSILIYAPANGTELDLSTVLQSSGAANPRRTGLKRKQSLAENPDDAIVNKNSKCFYNASDPANSVGRLIEKDGDNHNDAQCIQLSVRETNSQKLAPRSLVMTKINNHKMGAGQKLLLLERPARRERSCSTMTITNDAQCIQLSVRETNSQKFAKRSHVL